MKRTIPKLFQLFLMAPLLGLAGCLMQDGSPVASNGGGLRLLALNDGVSRTASGDARVFELGDVDGSTQQYFILQNTGDAPLTNITLSTDNPNLTFNPSTLAVLPPSDGISVVQVVKLNVVHGRRLDAEGWGGLLPAGDLQAALTVTSSPGNSGTAGGGAASARFDALVRLKARVMDAVLYDEGTPFDFSTPNLYTLGGSVFPGSQTVPVYTPTGAARLVNTGNAPLTVRLWKAAQAFDSTVVAPGQQYAIEVEAFDGASGFELESHGVVSDPIKFQKNNDGRFFFRVTRPIR